ncbi:phosphotransferase family protein [Mangrovicoccus sp. HB161399]|uniref:phosphotransferase family protein n=1 Tax=Mangrovicoccus sp. HB161399 TaxID=2720392 RepID=UPI0015537261|nr:phosphotransferase [Mangrovicoccus sp. HB161399]
MQTALVSDTDFAAVLAAACPGTAPEAVAPGPAALASPSYLGLDSRSARIAAPGGGLFLKAMHPEMRAGYDMAAAMQLAAEAGRLGAGPEVLWSDTETGAILMKDPGPDWAACRQWRLQDPDFAAAAICAMKRLHGAAPLAHRFDPFAAIDRAVAEAHESGIALPQDIGWVLSLLAPLRGLLLAAPTVPCRNDGSCSNLLAGPERGDVLLVDYDRAGMNDPMFDLGVLLAEITDFEADMVAPATLYMGGFDPAAFARARLWSVVDDVMHCVEARVTGAKSVRKGLEWLKYSEWRIMRARLGLNHPQFEEKIRIAGGMA